jgi:hypothetical protein
MPTQTPTGWRIAMAKLLGLSEGITSPDTCVVMAAASRNKLAAKCALKCPQGPMAPHSAVIREENSAPRASIRTQAAEFCSQLKKSEPGGDKFAVN